jgi:hypothetical protein
MSWLQIRLLGPDFSSLSTNSYGYYSQMSQNLFSNGRIFASAPKVRQAASKNEFYISYPGKGDISLDEIMPQRDFGEAYSDIAFYVFCKPGCKPEVGSRDT